MCNDELIEAVKAFLETIPEWDDESGYCLSCDGRKNVTDKPEYIHGEYKSSFKRRMEYWERGNGHHTPDCKRKRLMDLLEKAGANESQRNYNCL